MAGLPLSPTTGGTIPWNIAHNDEPPEKRYKTVQLLFKKQRYQAFECTNVHSEVSLKNDLYS